MEHAPLRPVPSRPAGPVDPATAVRVAAATLPALSPVEARALALVVLAERPREEVASALGVADSELGTLLARARKELRRTVTPLGGSGWCERAERLISDRLDAELGPTDASRLDAHLRNCPRCVEHERRLVQATDVLVLGLAPAPLPPAPLVEVTIPPEAPDETAADLGEAGEVGARSTAADITAAEATAAAAPTAADIAAATAPTAADIAGAAEVLVTVRTRRQIAAAITWNAMIAIAILLTVVTIALTVAGIVGAEF